MRNYETLEKLFNSKEAMVEGNKKLKEEKKQLVALRDELVEKKCKEFLDELKELSKYGAAGCTSIKLDYYRCYGQSPEIIHVTQENDFLLKANPSGYSKPVVLYDSNSGWDWKEKETKLFVAINKDKILDVIEEKITNNLTKFIKDTTVIESNERLKGEIEMLQ